MLRRLPSLVRSFAGLKLMLRNLPWTATKEEVTATVKALVQFERLDLPLNLDGRNRGFAFITFASEDEKQKAATALATLELGGRKLAVNEAEDRPRSPRRNPSGEPGQN